MFFPILHAVESTSWFLGNAILFSCSLCIASLLFISECAMWLQSLLAFSFCAPYHGARNLQIRVFQ